jgi:hypothetical protein
MPGPSPGMTKGGAGRPEARQPLPEGEAEARRVRRDRVRGCAAGTEGAFCGQGVTPYPDGSRRLDLSLRERIGSYTSSHSLRTPAFARRLAGVPSKTMRPWPMT